MSLSMGRERSRRRLRSGPKRSLMRMQWAGPLRDRWRSDFWDRSDLAIEGREVDLGPLRPRVRSLLRFLALHAGEPVHREAIEEALWPGTPPEAATRNLHVAVASLRRLLEPTAQRNGFRYIVRNGETYTLLTPDGSRVDLLDFEAAVDRLRTAEPGADGSDVEHWCRVALALFEGDLLPEEGPTDWVVARARSDPPRSR